MTRRLFSQPHQALRFRRHDTTAEFVRHIRRTARRMVLGTVRLEAECARMGFRV